MLMGDVGEYAFNRLVDIFNVVPVVQRPLGSYFVHGAEYIEGIVNDGIDIETLDALINQYATDYITERRLQSFFDVDRTRGVTLDYSKVRYYYDPYEEEMCGVCLGELRGSGIKTSCGHRFHKKCLLKWKKTGKTTCPFCRTPNSFFGTKKRSRK